MSSKNYSAKIHEARQELTDLLTRLSEAAIGCQRDENLADPLTSVVQLTSIMGEIADSACRLNNAILDNPHPLIKEVVQPKPYATITSVAYCYKLNENGDVIAHAGHNDTSKWHRCDDGKLMEDVWIKFKGGLIKGEINTHTSHSNNQWVAYYGHDNDCNQCFFSLSRVIEFLGEVDSPISLLQPGFSVLVRENL